MNKLEKIAGESEMTSDSIGDKRSIYQRVRDGVTSYLVDVSAGLIFYNPIMVVGEYLVAGMDSPEVLKSRIGSSIAQAVCMRPSGMLRNASAEHFNLTKESQWYKKGLSDTASILALQIPAYSIALYNAGVSIGEGGKALAMATAITAIMNNGTKLGFGKWMDFWRGLWGKKKAIK
ncbi:MAG: L-alanine exporter AlaE [Candidatus Pacearchaeota archaeon]|nr:L-alanine exporter AlaE [Candidatus Pacearchaeota archaeon]